MSEAQITELRTFEALVQACDEMASELHGVDTGEVWCKFTCRELESIASVLRLSGNAQTATFITHEHAVGDDEEDDLHHELGLSLVKLTEADKPCETCGFYHHHYHD